MKYIFFLLLFAVALNANAQTATPATSTSKDTTRYKETVPQFPGGGEGLYQFIHDNLKYPPEASEKKIEGTVVLQFIVNADGTISGIKTLQGVAGGCTEEAIRVINAMPRWQPGIKDGKPVGAYFNLPIVFQLSDDEANKAKQDSANLKANQSPKFLGGDDGLRDFLVKNLKYPEEATNNNISGTVILKFVISTTGDVSNIEVVQGVGGGCTEEAIRVVKAMPKWIPAKRDGKDAQVYYKMPIVFQLQK